MGTISLEHSDHLYWLGRYTERVFTSLDALLKVFDRLIDQDTGYESYLEAFGLPDVYGDKQTFIHSFLYDRKNQNSVAFSLARAYDNGIVLREMISTEALSFLQMAKDILKRSESTENPQLSLLPLKDVLYSFWGCVMDNVFDEEAWNLIFCGKSIERVDFCLRLHASYMETEQEFRRLCRRLNFVPKGTPYCYNSEYFATLSGILETEENYRLHSDMAMNSLEHLFEVSA